MLSHSRPTIWINKPKQVLHWRLLCTCHARCRNFDQSHFLCQPTRAPLWCSISAHTRHNGRCSEHYVSSARPHPMLRHCCMLFRKSVHVQCLMYYSVNPLFVRIPVDGSMLQPCYTLVEASHHVFKHYLAVPNCCRRALLTMWTSLEESPKQIGGHTYCSSSSSSRLRGGGCSTIGTPRAKLCTNVNPCTNLLNELT